MIQRYNIYGSIHEITQVVPAIKGTWVRYTDLVRYRRRYLMSLILNVAVVLTCAGMAAYLVTVKHAPTESTAVMVPMGAGEKAELLKELNEVRKGRDDFRKLSANYKQQIQILLKAVDDDDRQLEALQQRGKALDQLNKEQALKMGTAQETIIAAKLVLGSLGVQNVRIVNE